jgi:hypothetical protein
VFHLSVNIVSGQVWLGIMEVHEENAYTIEFISMQNPILFSKYDKTNL